MKRVFFCLAILLVELELNFKIFQTKDKQQHTFWILLNQFFEVFYFILNILPLNRLMFLVIIWKIKRPPFKMILSTHILFLVQNPKKQKMCYCKLVSPLEAYETLLKNMLQSIIKRGQKIVRLVFLFFGCLFHFMCYVKDKRLIG